jgi:DNA-binding IclR family transcriptional regulator
MPARGEQYFFISSLAKGLKVLELLAEKQALKVSEVARHLGQNRAASHRFLATLRKLGYVEKDEDDRYRLTFRVLEMGMKVANRNEVLRIVRPYMQELSLAFNETVNLGYFDGRDILHLDKIDSKEVLRMDSDLGSRAPAYCTALGKVLLAFLPKAARMEYLQQQRLRPQGPNTITSRKQLHSEIDRIREKGYAVDNEELAPGLRCVAAPVFDHTGRAAYAISVSGPAVRMTFERIEKISPRLSAVCEKISVRLGHSEESIPLQKM